jgi:hypothetical protein
MVSNYSCYLTIFPLPSLLLNTMKLILCLSFPSCSYDSQNKSSDENVGRALARSPFSAGTPVRACVSNRRWSARPVQRHATCVRRASSTSSTTSRRRSATPHLGSRTRLPRAISTGSTTPRIKRPRCVTPPPSITKEKKIDATLARVRVVSLQGARTS